MYCVAWTVPEWLGLRGSVRGSDGVKGRPWVSAFPLGIPGHGPQSPGGSVSPFWRPVNPLPALYGSLNVLTKSNS